VVAEESTKAREATRRQQDEQIAAAKSAGVTFYPLAAADRQKLVAEAAPVYKDWEARIGGDYLRRTRSLLGQ